MAKTKPALFVLPFCSVIYKEKIHVENSISFLEQKFSKILLKYGPIEFTKYTSYYEKEMGEILFKEYFFFNKLISAENFHLFKNKTNDYENSVSNDNQKGRIVNLDPGYLTQAKFVLFTVKNRAHRIYIGDGIYGEVQLEYRKNSFTSLHYSHSDYSDKDFIEFVNKARTVYRQKLKN